MSLPEVGDRIRLIEMPAESDPDPIPPGATGVVTGVKNALFPTEEPRRRFDQIWVEWEPPNEHRSLSLLPGIDLYEVIE